MCWLDEHNWNVWVSEIGADSAGGKLDFLINEAARAKRQGKDWICKDRPRD